MRQEGNPSRALAADLDADGRDEIIVVNTRAARLDVYHWQPPDRRDDPARGDAPNDLPMAVEFAKTEIPLEQVPADAAVVDGQLIVLVSSPDRILILQRDDDKWQQTRRHDLLAGGVTANHPLLRVMHHDTGEAELLISFDQGIQRLPLRPGARPNWLQPRVIEDRAGWWLADLDGDGDDDLIEWTRKSGQTVRWYERAGGDLLPAQVLHDRAATDVTVLPASGERPTLIAVIEDVGDGVVRCSTLGRDETNPLGRRRAYPLPDATKTAWTGMNLGDRRVLIVCDPQQPRLVVSDLTDEGWSLVGDYPTVADIRAIAPAGDGTLLIWARDAETLSTSTWQGGRFTFPKPLATETEGDGDRRVVGLGVAGDVTWWAQRVGKHVDLYMEPLEDGNTPIRFKDLGEKVDQVQWLGGDRILYKETYGRGLHLATPDNKSQPGDLARARLDEFSLIEGRAARINGGVLQWLDDNLHPTDQVMLPEGRQLIDLVVSPAGETWALQAGGTFAHRLEPDEAGILRVADTVRLPGGEALVRDAALGMMLVAGDRVSNLGPGEPRKLTLAQSVDKRTGRPHGTRDAAIHRLSAADLDGDGAADLLLHDDQRHQITALRRGDELTPLLSWPVFEDRAYPYGYPAENRVAEPRLVFTLDVDGDHRLDLAMFCHDRLLVYLAQQEESP